MSPHLRSLTGKTFTTPLSDVLPQTGPDEAVANESGRWSGSPVTESVESIEHRAAECNGYQRTESVVRDITPQDDIVPGHSLELKAGVSGAADVLGTGHGAEINGWQGTSGDHRRS